MELGDLLPGDGVVPAAPDDGGRLVRQDHLLVECQLLDVTVDVGTRRLGLLVDCRLGLVSDEGNAVVLVGRDVSDLRMDLQAPHEERYLQTILGSSVRGSDPCELRLVTNGISHLDAVALRFSLYVVDVHSIGDLQPDWSDDAAVRALTPSWQATFDTVVQSHT